MEALLPTLLQFRRFPNHPKEACFAFPSERVAKRACDYIRHKNGSQTPLRIQQFRDTGIYAVIFPS
eukprot:590227-Amorphochlora_amoeboformis.AAC.1